MITRRGWWVAVLALVLVTAGRLFGLPELSVRGRNVPVPVIGSPLQVRLRLGKRLLSFHGRQVILRRTRYDLVKSAHVPVPST